MTAHSGVDARRRVRRTKVVEVWPGGDGFAFTARLTDEAWNGLFGGPEQVVIHDIVLEGSLAGADLQIRELSMTPVFLPYAQCPRVSEAVTRLIGATLRQGWRKTVLAELGGSRGCTHVTTLLLGLAEVTTQVIFLEMNATTEYSAQSRVDGTWMTTGLEVAPGLADVCHSLTSDGVVLSPILRRSSIVNESVDAAEHRG